MRRAHREPKIGTIIPMAAYSMPAPTWRVKPQFAGWEIDHTRFEIKRLLGNGSYGSVAEAIDHLTNQRVAIKKIPAVFEVCSLAINQRNACTRNKSVYIMFAGLRKCEAYLPRGSHFAIDEPSQHCQSYSLTSSQVSISRYVHSSNRLYDFSCVPRRVALIGSPYHLH